MNVQYRVVRKYIRQNAIDSISEKFVVEQRWKTTFKMVRMWGPWKNVDMGHGYLAFDDKNEAIAFAQQKNEEIRKLNLSPVIVFSP